MEKHTLITISRQFGSGGREVAEILAKKLGVRRYDKKIVEMAADNIEEGMDPKEAVELSTTRRPTASATSAITAMSASRATTACTSSRPRSSSAWRRRRAPSSLDRCADYILKDKPNSYSFFIYADDDFRAKRAKTDYDGATLEQLNKEETRRKQYYEFYTGQTWGAPEHYDLMINTSNMPLEDVADFILDYIKKNPRG